MKKWNKPELLTLGVAFTENDIIPIDSENQKHFCHFTGDPSCIEEHKDHSASGSQEHTFTGGNNGGCTWPDHQKNRNACCCYS